MTDATPPVVLPRNLIILAFFWLLVAWVQTIGFRPPIQPTAPSYEPGVRMMLVFVMMGLVVAWPLYRLSQKPPPWPIQQTLLDLIVLLSMVQVVVWPLRLVTTWMPARTAAIDFAMIGWGVLIGALIAIAMSRRTGSARFFAMMICLLAIIAGPLLNWLVAPFGHHLDQAALTSPILLVNDLGLTGPTRPRAEHWSMIAVIFAVGFTGWAVLAVARAVAARKTRHGGAPELSSTD